MEGCLRCGDETGTIFVVCFALYLRFISSSLLSSHHQLVDKYGSDLDRGLARVNNLMKEASAPMVLIPHSLFFSL